MNQYSPLHTHDILRHVRCMPHGPTCSIPMVLSVSCSWTTVLCSRMRIKSSKTRMWANAQRDGRPAECRCRPLFNAANWLTPTTRVPCSNAVKTRKPLKFAGVPQINQRISAANGPKSPYCKNVWGRYCCLTNFFQLSIYALLAKI